MLFFILDGQASGHLIQVTAALAGADHTHHQLRKGLPVLHGLGQADSFSKIRQHRVVDLTLRRRDTLLPGNDIQRPHQTDAGSQKRGQLPAERRQLLRLKSFMTPGFRQVLRLHQIQAVPQQIRGQCFFAGCLDRSFFYFSLHVLRDILKTGHLLFSFM